MTNLELFAILDREGNLLTKRYGGRAVYTRKADAIKYARQFGDNVVRVTVHRDQAPLYIKEPK